VVNKRLITRRWSTRAEDSAVVDASKLAQASIIVVGALVNKG
jgi:hypothetical protein